MDHRQCRWSRKGNIDYHDLGSGHNGRHAHKGTDSPHKIDHMLQASGEDVTESAIICIPSS